MVHIIWSERAISDLNSIAEYFAFDSGYAANKFVSELIQRAEILLAYPEMGRFIPENIPGKYRQILHKNYRIIYKIKNESIVISSIYHQKKLLIKITEAD